MQFKKLLFFIISTTMLLTGCDSKNEENKKQDVTKKDIIKKESPNINLTSLNGQALTLTIKDKELKVKELEGKVILLNFFATWCPPCKAEIPHLVNLKEKYKENLEIIAINVGEKGAKLTDTDKINSFVEDYKINYLVTNVENNFKVSEAMGNITTIPTMFLFNTEGKTVQKYVGVVPEEMLETDIKKALGK